MEGIDAELFLTKLNFSKESLNFIETLKTLAKIQYSPFKSYPNPKSGAKNRIRKSKISQNLLKNRYLPRIPRRSPVNPLKGPVDPLLQLKSTSVRRFEKLVSRNGTTPRRGLFKG